MNLVGTAVPDEGRAALAADRGMEGDRGERHICAQADYRYISALGEDDDRVAQGGKLYRHLPRYCCANQSTDCFSGTRPALPSLPTRRWLNGTSSASSTYGRRGSMQQRGVA